MRVERLTAVNIKRLEEINIAPAKDAHLVIIAGENGQGKTSTLDSIWYALGGTRAIPEKPIRDGQTWAEIEVDLGDWVVKRRWNSRGKTELVVEGKDGSIVKQPQTWLNALVDKLSFDALEFSRMDSKKQFETLRDLVGLDLGPLDGERQRTFEERAGLNREIKNYEGQLEGYPLGLDRAPDEPVNVTELTNKAMEVSSATSCLTQAKDLLMRRSERAVEIERRIKDLQKDLVVARKEQDDADEGVTQAAEVVVGLESLDDIKAKIDSAEQTNDLVRQKKERAAARLELQSIQSDADRLTRELKAIDVRRQEAIAAANFPIDGLALEDGAVMYDHIPFYQAAESEKLRVSVAIGLALNPKLKVLLIRDGSLLDLDSLKEVEEMAREHDAQIWIERVGKQGPVSYIIEDGRVLEEVPSD